VNPQQTPQKTERIHHRDPTQHAAAIDPTPCFYPDSQGVMRLWDGQRWTEATRPMPHPATPPTGQPGYYTDSQGVMRWWTGRDWAPHTQPPGTGQPEPEKGNWIQRNVGWKLGVLLAILGLASCGAIINTIGGGEDPATTAQPTSATMATTAPPVDETTEPEPEPEPTQKTVKIGEKVRDDSYQFTVTNVRCRVSRVGSQYLGEKAQGQFCLVKLRVKNVGDDPIYFSDENQALVDRKGKPIRPMTKPGSTWTTANSRSAKSTQATP
jgi:hypothetical protein